MSGVSSLFTEEFYARINRQLAHGGMFVQWIQVYEFTNRLLATILRALDAEFGDYAVYAANDGDMIVVASNARLPTVSAEFTRFPGLAPTLSRLAMNSVDEIELRRLAGAATVRSLLAELGPGSTPTSIRWSTSARRASGSSPATRTPSSSFRRQRCP